jgi:hypothetical protein
VAVEFKPAKDETESPAELGTAPRKIRRRRGRSVLWFQMLALPFIGLFAFMSFYFSCAFTLVALRGTSVATVTQRTASLPAIVRQGVLVMKERGPYTVTYTYVEGGREHTDQVRVKTDEEAKRLAVGSKLTIKCLHIAGLGNSMPVEPLGETLLEAAVSMLLAGTGAVFAIFLFRMFFILPRRRRWLVQNGQAVAGRINVKSPRLPNESYKRLGYEYTVGANRFSQVIIAHRSVYDGVEHGQVVTVLYDPRRPRRSVAHELAEFGVVDSAGNLVG